MNLSANFTLPEMTKTSKTQYDNIPTSAKIINNLKAVCQNILEEARANFGRTVIVHSGYRSPAVNRAVGGSLKSEHVLG